MKKPAKRQREEVESLERLIGPSRLRHHYVVETILRRRAAAAAATAAAEPASPPAEPTPLESRPAND
jgi:hypothetical protein